ncbi:ATP-binding protein [uncultured Chitinophaga sp.]|jgi:Signal transduction histidine kinase involved in nitrogen fixation and metabolism regulation|uniref:sensor histidine kinase n=1 Tax=uncultured Chitinophaga sp. TaxID=339340 RepID=UPI00262827F7|nr:ATP-binding protein [uncultured Chitinophaga sp.]
MKLRTKYILFLSVLHLLALVLSWFVFKENKILFIVAELIILLSVFISWRLYQQLVGPLKLLVMGTEAIKDRDFNVKLVHTGKYEMDALIDVYNRMIDELRQERTRQQEQHLFLEKLVNTSPTGIIILDHDGNVAQVNPKASQLMEMKGTDMLTNARQLPRGGSLTVTYNNALTYRLQKSQFIDRGFPREFILIEELTAEILAAEKKAYGKVIRMMAHEVNNTIGPVNSILQSALSAESLQNGQNGNMLQHALRVAVERNHNLNHFMRNFADVVRLPEPLRKEIDLHQLVNNVARLMEMKAGEKEISFEYQLEEGPFHIHADQEQMEQVLINIVKNAMEAIEYKGHIEFITRIREKQLVIADSGKGISSKAAAQLFSPFFSTKKNGQGIGLTLIREILHHHGFELSLTTVAPGRTEFLIQFVL